LSIQNSSIWDGRNLNPLRRQRSFVPKVVVSHTQIKELNEGEFEAIAPVFQKSVLQKSNFSIKNRELRREAVLLIYRIITTGFKF
jgi:hypothetical protein